MNLSRLTIKKIALSSLTVFIWLAIFGSLTDGEQHATASRIFLISTAIIAAVVMPFAPPTKKYFKDSKDAALRGIGLIILIISLVLIATAWDTLSDLIIDGSAPAWVILAIATTPLVFVALLYAASAKIRLLSKNHPMATTVTAIVALTLASPALLILAWLALYAVADLFA